MLSVAEAQALILQHAQPLAAVRVPLDQVQGLVLAEDVACDRDSPPFDKALMDGYAVRSADLAPGGGAVTVIEEVLAGQVPQRTVAAGQATRIMTGAPVPAGADAVVPVERTRSLDEQQVQIDDQPSPGRNIFRRGQEMHQGETVLTAGTLIQPQVVGLLANLGRAMVHVQPRPTVAVLPTGDELVEVGETPGVGQIRNSNGPMLLAQVSRAGGTAQYLGIGRDRLDSLRPLVEQGLQASILVLSGGVSAGKLDLVPGLLQDLGVQAQFHKVAMKPGKPAFFGVWTRAGRTTLVFGLPGNPVSSLVCFELFVRPALRRLLGIVDAVPPTVPLPLAEPLTYATDRPTYLPARVDIGSTGWQVRAVPWQGSADLRGLARTNALIVVKAGEHRLAAGQVVPVQIVED